MSVTNAELRKLETLLDQLFDKIGVDIVFTRHFMDRVNDVRNSREIEIEELRDIFLKAYRKYSTYFPKMRPDIEAVLTDLQSQLNIPFVMKWDKRNSEFDLVSKTVMRKKNFKTSNRKLQVEAPVIYRALLTAIGKKIDKKTWDAATEFYKKQLKLGKAKDLSISRTARTFGIDLKPFSRYINNLELNESGVVIISDSLYNEHKETIDEYASDNGVSVIMVNESISTDEELMLEIEREFKKKFPFGFFSITKRNMFGSPVIGISLGLIGDVNELTSKIRDNDPMFHSFLIDLKAENKYESRNNRGSLSVNPKERHLAMSSVKTSMRKTSGDANKILKAYITFFAKLKKIVKENESDIYSRDKYSDKYFK